MKAKQDKDRRSSVPAELLQYATDYINSHHQIGSTVDTCLATCRLHLQQLATRKTTTDDQARLLRTIGTLLVQEITTHEQEFISNVTKVHTLLRLVIRFYFYPETKPIHKQVSWIMEQMSSTITDKDASSNMHKFIHNTFQEQFLHFINGRLFQDDANLTGDFNEYTVQLETFEFLNELESFRADITPHIFSILAKSAHVLEKLFGNNSVAQQLLPQSVFIIVGLFKLITSLATKNMEAMKTAIEERNKALGKIVECGFRAMINPHFSRDAQRVPLLILYKLLDLSFTNKEEIGDLFLISYFGEDSKVTLQELESELPSIFVHVVVNRESKYLHAAFTHFTEMSKIAAIGSIFNAFDSVTLLREQDRQGTPFSLLFDGAFPQLCTYSNTGSTSLHKLLALQRILAAAMQIKEIASQHVSLDIQKRIAQTVKQLFNIVFDNWENTMHNIHEVARDTFAQALEIHDLLEPSIKEIIDIQSYTRFLVNTDWACKGKYPTLNALQSRIGVKGVLSASPDIFKSIVAVMGVPAVNTQASTLFGQLALELNKEVPRNEWEEVVLIPIVEAVGSVEEHQRSAIFTYLMPKLIKNDANCVPYMLSRLKTLRDKQFQLEFFGDNHLTSIIQTMKIAKTNGVLNTEQLDPSIVREGLIHASEEIRLSTFDLMITSVKSTEPPTDLDLLEQFFVLNLKNSGPLFRYQYCSTMNRFFKRIRDSSYKIYNVYERKKNIHVLFGTDATKDTKLIQDRKEYHSMMKFLSVITTFLQNSMYPGCTHEKLILCIEIYKLLIQTFMNNSSIQVFDTHSQYTTSLWTRVNMFPPSLITTLLNTFLDCWDKVRESLYELLVLIPSPLPSYHTPELVQELIQCALKLMTSARQRESDSAALILRLVFAKYMPLGWTVDEQLNLIQSSTANHSNIYSFLRALLLILKKSTDACEKDIFNITREHALIGHLASIHNIIRDIDFSIEEKRGSEHKLLWRELIDDLMETVTRGCTLANKVISDMNDDDEESTINVDCRGHVYFDNTEQQTVDYSRVHALTVNCWLTVKEACTLLGTISERVPMHKSTITKDVLGEECMITTTRLKHLGKLFMDMLLSTKHIGAIEKSQVGFQCLCKRLLICNIPELSVLPGQWLEDMIAIILKQETSILRRSAGVPFCIIALVKAEPQSMPRVLLPRVMKFLFELTSQENILKTDEESARKTVHALNILRAIFHEATLATHITQYIESGFTCSLNGFCSTNWTVRNSSLMCYTSLMQRALGKNVKVSSDHALTSREFFSRYPSLRPLLVSQLSIATKDHNSLHPSLYPSLLLLSRLRSMTDVSDDSSDEDMVPLVKQCVNNRHYMARTLAAKALVPLIEKTRYNDYVASIFEELDSCKSSNKRHGLLCQLYRFIKSEFNIEWLVKLVERLDQLTVKNQCHVSRTIYFKILSRMLRTAHANRDSIDSTLLSRVVDTTLPNSVFTKDTSNVGTALMQAQATTAVLQALHILNNQDLLAKTIVELISHDSYTARVALYEFMTKNNVEWIHDGEYQYVRKAILKSVLLEEMDVNVLTAGLTVIHTLLDRSFSNDFEHDRSLLWNRLLSFIKGANAYVKEQAIIVMGLLIRDDSMTKEWIDIMTEHVKPTQQDNLRLACQKSIKLSNMLKSDSGSAQLCAWKCCVILLQDEDEEIRKETASMLSYLISSSKYDLQVEYVLEACMNRMTELFHDNQEYIQFLLEFASLRDKQGQIQFQLEQIDQAPLFDPEPENIFVEALFTAQLAANQLYKISKNKPVNDTLLVEELQVVLDTVEKKNNVYHVGDLSNHTQIFLALYRVALGLRAVRSTNLKSMEDKLLHVLRSPNATLLNVFNELIPFEELMYTITQK